MQPQELYRSQQFATAVYRSELAARLHDLGYDLVRGASGQPEIRGYSDAYLEASSPRRQQIEAHLEAHGQQGAGQCPSRGTPYAGAEDRALARRDAAPASGPRAGVWRPAGARRRGRPRARRHVSSHTSRACRRAWPWPTPRAEALSGRPSWASGSCSAMP